MKTLNDFLLSVVKSEFQIESYFFSQKGLDFNEKLGIPKVYNSKFFLSLPLFVLRVVDFFALFLLFFINFIFLVRLFCTKIILKNVSFPDIPDSKCSILIDSCDIACPLFCRAVVNRSDDMFSFSVGRPLRSRSSTVNSVDFDALYFLGFVDLLRIFFNSCIYVFKYCSHSDLKAYKFLSVYFFEILVVYEAINKFRKHNASVQLDLYSVDHYDRWAVLASYLKDDGVVDSYSIVQHGALAFKDASEFKIKVPNKITGVNRLYYSDVVSLDVFSNNIIANFEAVELIKFDNSIELVDISSSSFDLLIIGSPICFDFHLDLLCSILTLGLDLKVYYKPHPTHSNYGSSGRESWILWEAKNTFPNVDLVISYPSTLAKQYGDLSIPVVYHKLNPDSGALDKIISEIKYFYGEFYNVT